MDPSDAPNANGNPNPSVVEGTPPTAPATTKPDASPTADGPAVASPEDVAKKLSAFEAENKKLKEDNTTMRTYMQGIMESLRTTQPGGATKEPDPDEIADAFRDDPVGSTDRLVNERLRPVREEGWRSQSLVNKQLMIAELKQDTDGVGSLYPDYADKVEEFMKKVPLNVQATPEAWPNAFKFVIANDIKNVMTKLKDRQPDGNGKGFVEGPGVGGGSRPRDHSTDLTPEEKKVADAFSLTPQEYIKWRDAAGPAA